MLSGKGFENVYNLSGGIRDWNSDTAIGGEELGIAVFTGDEPPEKTLIVAYALESGLEAFYLSMIPKVNNDAAKQLFTKLGKIEVKHKERVFDEFLAMTGQPVDREEFERTAVADAVEGGLTTEEYAELFKPDWESAADIVSLAMSIEAQALDLYMRAAERADNPKSRAILLQIAGEENAHLRQLGRLMDGLV